jgi:hypothetical protein
MKKLLTILCSLLVALAFVSVTSAADVKGTKVQNIPPNSKKGNPAPKLNTKVTDTKATTEEQKEEKKETKDAKKGKKVEKKEEQIKADEKK